MLYTDPIYRNVEIHEPVILELINSPAIQRLQGIEQGGYYAPYFPEAKKHSRFEHSIGVYLLLKKYGAPLEEQVAGLIHDVSHGTFSHCLDYIFQEEDQKHQDHQDNIFETFIKKTDIPDILKTYDLDIDYIIDDAHFPLKEMTLPDLCADRIDYILRDAWHDGEVSAEEIIYILDHLIVKDKKRIFTDLKSAKAYAELFHRINEKYYSGLESAIMHQTVGYCLKYAREQGYLHMDDFYTTDKQVVDKIIAHIETDEQLNIYWQRMNNKIPCKNDPKDFDYNVFCKSRVVDPLFLDMNTVKRVSDVDKEWGEIVQIKSPAKEYFLKFEK